MKRILTYFVIAAMLCSCELHDDVSATVKRKAIIHMVYHYDNGQKKSLDGVESIRLFIFDQDGILFRDTMLTTDVFIRDSGAMQTYLPNGRYSFISWANVGRRTQVTPATLEDAMLTIDTSGADCLMFGRCDTPIEKGDSLQFHIDLFKSVFKINVTVNGLAATLLPQDHYFGIMNRSRLTIDNQPSGVLKRFLPELNYSNGTLSGSFYTPYFSSGDNFTVGVYCDNPASLYTTLCETSIREFTQYIEPAIGHDVEINVLIDINAIGISIQVTDWEGNIIQQEHLGN